jgi:hypothetical protein
MGRQSRADLISQLKTAGAKGSLSKMNRSQLAELHAQMVPGGSGSSQLPSVAPIASNVKIAMPVETGAGQRQSTTALRIDPDEDDISDYLQGGSFWRGLAGDVSKVGHTIASEAQKLQKTDAVKDVELAGVDVGEVAADVGADTAALAGSTAVGNPELAGPASVAIDVGSHEAADSLREKIRDS